MGIVKLIRAQVPDLARTVENFTRGQQAPASPERLDP